MRKATKLMMIQDAQRHEDQRQEEMRRAAYSPERGDRRMIGFDREETDMRRRRDDRGRYARYEEPDREWPETEHRYRDDEIHNPYMGSWYPEDRHHRGGPMYMPYAMDMHGGSGRTITGSGHFAMNYPPEYQAMGGHDENGMESRPLDEHSAREWVRKMRNADGSTGEHFSVEQTEQYRAGVCPECKKWDFYAAMNMIFSDYGEVARKMGTDRAEFYAHMAKAFLCDDDARENKISRYERYIGK